MHRDSHQSTTRGCQACLPRKPWRRVHHPARKDVDGALCAGPVPAWLLGPTIAKLRGSHRCSGTSGSALLKCGGSAGSGWHIALCGTGSPAAVSSCRGGCLWCSRVALVQVHPGRRRPRYAVPGCPTIVPKAQLLECCRALGRRSFGHSAYWWPTPGGQAAALVLGKDLQPTAQQPAASSRAGCSPGQSG